MWYLLINILTHSFLMRLKVQNTFGSSVRNEELVNLDETSLDSVTALVGLQPQFHFQYGLYSRSML